MQESVHGRNVLTLIQSMDQPVQQDILLESLHQTFGFDARFHTCSIQDASAEELVAKFIEKGKLTKSEDGIHFVGCGCKHH